MSSTETPPASTDFIREIIEKDLETGKNGSAVVTRFPPEPNGYLHLGHAKSICLNFGLAQQYQGRCHLRFDDTNPAKEDPEYVDSIQEDVRWLGFDWNDHLFHASDYFEKLYDFAVQLISKGKAYVCDLSTEEMRQNRGVPTRPGTESPYRNRSVEENLDLFGRMRQGEFAEGQKALRAKIDMASPNLHLRDPVIYRIKKAAHHRTGDKWVIYPMYDFTHCLSDSIEGITHSVCTLEFEVHRPLYDWVLNELEVECHPQQIEFARLKLSYTVMSKRKLLELVEEGLVDGWDDPRMPTISGIRRRGYSAESVREFCKSIGVTKFNGMTDIAVLEHSVRSDLNRKASRTLAVLNPLKVVIENLAEDYCEELDAVNNPEDPEAGKRKIPFGREIYIDRDDFMESPPKRFHRLSPGNEVRLKYAYIMKCERVIKDQTTGEILEVRCVIDPETRSGMPGSERKVKGVIGWVDAKTALDAEVRLYDRLFDVPDPAAKEKDGVDFKTHLNPESLTIVKGCKIEAGMASAKPGDIFQFERIGYFTPDLRYSAPGALVFNRTVSLRDNWSKTQQAPQKK